MLNNGTIRYSRPVERPVGRVADPTGKEPVPDILRRIEVGILKMPALATCELALTFAVSPVGEPAGVTPLAGMPEIMLLLYNGAMASRPQYRSFLRPEESPSGMRDVFNYETQFIEQRSGRGHMTVERTCSQCQRIDRTKVSTVRSSIKIGTLSGLCHPCSLRRGSDQPKGDKSIGWKGGKSLTKRGYVYARFPTHPNARNGYVFEHRLVMEQALGRLLLPCETVHHKNGIKEDNRLENLELWAKSHGDGKRYADMTSEQLENLIGILCGILEQRKYFNLKAVALSSERPFRCQLKQAVPEA